MQIATLIAGANAQPLSKDFPDDLRRDWEGGESVWLSPGEAVEFEIPDSRVDAARDPAVFAAWQALQERKVDLSIQPVIGRRKRILIADMDGTMIEQECIDELADEAGVGDRVAAITARAMNGELDFESALAERVSLLAGLPEETITAVLENRIALRPGGETLVATMKAQGAHTVLVSGGFTAFANVIAAWLGFDEFRANVLEVESGKLTGTVAHPIVGREDKARTLTEVAARLGISERDAIAVGDGANDLDMLKLAGTGVAFRAKPVVAEQCDVRVCHGDLTSLLYLQGYSRSEFVVP